MHAYILVGHEPITVIVSLHDTEDFWITYICVCIFVNSYIKIQTHELTIVIERLLNVDEVNP
jgi:hypothetical protein